MTLNKVIFKVFCLFLSFTRTTCMLELVVASLQTECRGLSIVLGSYVLCSRKILSRSIWSGEVAIYLQRIGQKWLRHPGNMVRITCSHYIVEILQHYTQHSTKLKQIKICSCEIISKDIACQCVHWQQLFVQIKLLRVFAKCLKSNS